MTASSDRRILLETKGIGGGAEIVGSLGRSAANED